MFLIRLAVDRPVLTTMFILAIVVFGGFSYTQLSQDLTPEIDFPIVVVMTVYPGAGPKEVETQVTEKIEDEVASVAGLKRMTSQSLENLSLIICEFHLEIDGNQATLDTKDKVDMAMVNLPDEADPPVVQQFDIQSTPILNVALSSDRPLPELTLLAETKIKDILGKVNGVSNVEVVGGLEREINISCYQDRLRSYGLTINEVVGFLAAENLNYPSGHIIHDGNEYSLRVVSEFKTIDEIRSMRLITSTGSIVYLKDVATVKDSYEEPREQARFQGKSAVSLQVMKKTDANTVLVSRAIQKEVEKIAPLLAQEQVQYAIANDRAHYIEDSVQDVLSNIIIGIFLTALLLYLFLHDYRATLIVAITMPSCVVATFSLMFFADFTLNIISLMALGISIGVLVSNSIVVLENISNKLAAGESSRSAAINGTTEVAIAVVASAGTNLVVFAPISFMKGIIGQFFYQFGLTVIFATLFSLIISFTLTPMLARFILAKPQKRRSKSKGKPPSLFERFGLAWDRGYNDLKEDYLGALMKVMQHKKLMVAVTFLVFFGGCGLLTQVGSEFFPMGDEGIFRIDVKLPPGAGLVKTDETLKLIEEKLKSVPEVDTVLAEIGGEGKGVEDGMVTVQLIDISKRERSVEEITNSLRPAMATIPAAEIALMIGSERGPGKPIEIEITGPNLDKLTELSSNVMDLARQVDGIIDIQSTYKSGKPELMFLPDRDKMIRYGITSAAIAQELWTSYEGTEKTYFRENNEDYDIRIQLAESERHRLKSYQDTMIKAGDAYVPLAHLGTVQYSQSAVKIEHKDKQRLVQVEAGVSGITTGEAAEQLQALIDENITLESGYDVHFAGQAEFMKREFGYIFQALFLAIILTYMVLAAILEDFIHPFTIMLTLPLGLVGTALGLFLGGISINMMSLMAIVMLVGIVVNNAILILDYAKQLRMEGESIMTALLKSAQSRLRPIIMTNLAIAISVLPQALGGAGAEYRQALAVVTMGGVLISAFFTIFLIPAIYTTFDKFAIKPQVDVDKEAKY